MPTHFNAAQTIGTIAATFCKKKHNKNMQATKENYALFVCSVA